MSLTNGLDTGTPNLVLAGDQEFQMSKAFQTMRLKPWNCARNRHEGSETSCIGASPRHKHIFWCTNIAIQAMLPSHQTTTTNSCSSKYFRLTFPPALATGIWDAEGRWSKKGTKASDLQMLREIQGTAQVSWTHPKSKHVKQVPGNFCTWCRAVKNWKKQWRKEEYQQILAVCSVCSYYDLPGRGFNKKTIEHFKKEKNKKKTWHTGDRQTDKQTNRQPASQAGRHKHTQVYIYIYILHL